MIDKLKWYFAEVVLPKYVPVAVLSGLGYVVAFMVSHASFLEPYGITTGQWPLKMDAPSGMVTLIEWATLGTKTGAVLAILIPTLIVAIQHHVTGAPVVPGGRREEDPPASVPKA
jgi:hypothetical protein